MKEGNKRIKGKVPFFGSISFTSFPSSQRKNNAIALGHCQEIIIIIIKSSTF